MLHTHTPNWRTCKAQKSSSAISLICHVEHEWSIFITSLYRSVLSFSLCGRPICALWVAKRGMRRTLAQLLRKHRQRDYARCLAAGRHRFNSGWMPRRKQKAEQKDDEDATACVCSRAHIVNKIHVQCFQCKCMRVCGEESENEIAPLSRGFAICMPCVWLARLYSLMLAIADMLLRD